MAFAVTERESDIRQNVIRHNEIVKLDLWECRDALN